MHLATICDTGIRVTGTDRDDVADKIAQILAGYYRDTGNDAWLYAEAVDDRGVFAVEIDPAEIDPADVVPVGDDEDTDVE